VELTSAEMFSGIGGFRFGLEKSGWKTVWANDVDKYACQVYRRNFGDKELVEGDIRTVDPETIPDHTLLTAGFPCPSFSLAGKRKGFQDVRGTLFYEVVRVARAKRPQLLLLENVKGLLSNDNGKTFGTILESLGSIGYWCEWQTLNSKHFGVPQNRERVFIVGHLRAKPSRQIFPVRCNGSISDEEDASSGSCLKSPLRSQGDKPMIYDGHHHQFTAKMGTLTGRENRQGTNWLIMRSHTKANIKQRQQDRRDTWTLDGTSSKMAIASAVDCDGYLRSGKRPRDEHGKPQLLPIGYRRIRRLTPIECERLQGFPDGWTEGVSDTQRYKLLGNAVTVNVVEFLGWRLRECLS